MPDVFLLRTGLLHQGMQMGQHAVDAVSGLPDLLLGLMDAIQYRPVGKDPVKEVVGHPQKSINADLKIRVNGHISKLGLEPAQLRLELFHLGLGIVQMAMLCHVGEQASAKQIPGAPALCAVQAGGDLVGGGQGLFAGGAGLLQLPLLALQIGGAGLQLQNLFRRTASDRFHRLGFCLQQVGVPALAVLKPIQLTLTPAQVLLDPGQFSGHRVILDPGGVGLLLLLGQLFFLFSDDVVEEGRQAPTLQALHVFLFRLEVLLQFPGSNGIGIPLGTQLCRCGFQLLFPGALGLQLAQLLVITAHTFLLLSSNL